MHELDTLVTQTIGHIRLVAQATTAVTAQIDAIGDADAVGAADLRAARNLMHKLTSSMEQVLLDLRIARDATDGLDHRAAILLALDLSDTLPWTEDAR
jgi:hypothetical protein